MDKYNPIVVNIHPKINRNHTFFFCGNITHNRRWRIFNRKKEKTRIIHYYFYHVYIHIGLVLLSCHDFIIFYSFQSWGGLRGSSYCNRLW